MKVKNIDRYNDVDTQTAIRGEIRSDRESGRMIWDKVGDCVYITCRSCDAINDISGHLKGARPYYDGYIKAPCFVCTNCRAHYYFRLEGWGFEFGATNIYCYKCGSTSRINDKGDIRAFRKAGWLISKKPGETRCGGCRRRR